MQQDSAPFCWAVASSYGLSALQSQRDQAPWLACECPSWLEPPMSWPRVQAIYYARQKEWPRALDILGGEQHKALVRLFISQALRDRLIERDWIGAVQLVWSGLEISPRDQKLKALAIHLREPVQKQLWHSRDYEALAEHLL